MLRAVSLLCLVLGSQSELAPFINPCKNSDADCILASSKAALPVFVQGSKDLGIKTLDPLHIHEIQSDNKGLKLTFKDSTLEGLKNCVLETSKIDTAKMKLTLQVKCSVKLSGDYTLDGKLLILPVQGQGKYDIDIRDIVIKTILNLTTVDGSDGKPHWHVSKRKLSFKVLTGSTFDFKNLFNGNELLARPVIEFANSNWKDVMQEISPPVVEAIVGEVCDAIDALFAAVPLNELSVLN